MATTVSTAEQRPSTASALTKEQESGVAPLRAGEGHEFLLRRLHSLSGIIPVGAFLFEHIALSNSAAIKGPVSYAHQVAFLSNLPFVFFLELFGIWLPIAFHGGYGVWLWYRGKGNLVSYPWLGNWTYSLQRWSGGIAFAFIIYHTYTKRFTGVDLHDLPGASFGKMQESLSHPWLFAFYVVGLIASCWHFGYGIWLFCCKWGVVVGERARKRLLVLSVAFAVLLSAIGLRTLVAFTQWPQQATDPKGAKAIEKSDSEILHPGEGKK
jgi:succinate dehydrogenase / fumarate reductase cytochrome b subunit